MTGCWHLSPFGWKNKTLNCHFSDLFNTRKWYISTCVFFHCPSAVAKKRQISHWYFHDLLGCLLFFGIFGGDLTLYKYRYILFSCCQMTQKFLAKCPWRWRWLAIVVLKIIFLKKRKAERLSRSQQAPSSRMLKCKHVDWLQPNEFFFNA